MFCKGSNNPFWFHGDEKAPRTYVGCMDGLLKPGGWAWIVSCPYTQPVRPDSEMLAWLEVEDRIYRERGYQAWTVPGRFKGGFYGISYVPPRLLVYTKRLPGYRPSASLVPRMAGYIANLAVRKLGRMLG